MEGIHLSVEKAGSQDSISIIKVGGYIDTTTSSELEQALNNLIKAGSCLLIIDLGNVDYVSSAGWGIFISEIKGIREKGGDLKLVNMVPEVYEVFELLEFHHILKAFDTVEQAIADFERPGSGKHLEPKKEIKIQKPKETPRVEPVVKEESQKTVHAANLSIDEKIKKIIAADPDISSIQIVKLLNTPEYGYVKIGWFGLRRSLKRLDLDNKKKRKWHSITYNG